MQHKIKLNISYCAAVFSGEKNFEVRNNDRGYQKGDMISFIPVSDNKQVMHPISDKLYTITYVHSGLGLKKNWVILAIKEV